MVGGVTPTPHCIAIVDTRHGEPCLPLAATPCRRRRSAVGIGKPASCCPETGRPAFATSPTMNANLKKFTKPLAYALFTIGFDPRRLGSLRHFARYTRDARSFRRMGGRATHAFPIVTDFTEQAGSARGHYFHQDLLVASFVHRSNPSRHIDIGSRIDGFVAHVASFRKIEVMDVRSLESTGHENISFLRSNLMDRDMAADGIADSISCLHAIEHFGLGRYGDPIDPEGHIKGFRNILRMLKPGGSLYISFPIGKANEVHFNAHRVFHPKDIFTWAEDESMLRMNRFDYVDDEGKLHQNVDLEADPVDVVFGCGIYTFQRAR